MKDGQFVYSFHSDGNFNYGFFDSKEEVLEVGGMAAGELLKHKFYIGQVKTVGLPCVDVDSLLERIAEEMADDFGEHAEDYLWDLPRDQLDELQDDLDRVLHEWVLKYKHEPTFYRVENVEEVKVV